MEKTNSQIQSFRDMGTLYLRYSGEQTKLHFAVDKMVKKLKSIHEKYIDDQGDVRSENAAIDPVKKVILKDERGEYLFDAAKEKAVRKALRDLANKEIDIEPHMISPDDVPPSLGFKYRVKDSEFEVKDYDVRLAFEGFVIPQPQ